MKMEEAELRFRELLESVRRDIARREAARIEREDLKDAITVLFFYLYVILFIKIFFILLL